MHAATSWRLFVALPVPEQVAHQLLQVQVELRQAIPPGSASWTKPGNLHLTLRFLGEVDMSRLEALQSGVRTAVAGVGRLALACERLGCFPDQRFPRVVWAAVRDERNRLSQLVERVNAATAPFAERPPDAAFICHITLARLKRIGREEARRLSRVVDPTMRRNLGAWQTTELELVRSELGAGGSRYTTVAKFNLE